MDKDKLKMSFDPHTIEHLGIKMYSNIPNAIAELIANAYDAEAENVHIKLFDNGDKKSITIVDDGEGMDFDDINTKFLRIGRKRRLEDGNPLSPNGKRKVTGKKGLGKLAFFGIGDTITIITKKNASQVKFTLDWNDILKTCKSEYEPHFQITPCDSSENGTTVILENLKRKTPFDKTDIAISLSKLFNFFDSIFNVDISLNDDESLKINNELKYKNIKNIQFTWDFPDFTNLVPIEYSEKNKINGKIISTEKPLNPGLRGVTLFANGRLVNAPEFFGVSESSHGFSYFTGWLNVDFIDDLEKDVISTDRQSLNWGFSETEILKEFLKKSISLLERDWRKKRKIEKQKTIKDKTNIDLTSWYNKLPNDIKLVIEPIVQTVVDESELTTAKQVEIIENLHGIIPEYPYFHWRNLHPVVKESSKDDYDKKDYYRAFEETIKRYISEVRVKSDSKASSDSSMMSEVFGKIES